MDTDTIKQLQNLVKQLRRKSSIEWKRVGQDYSHYEGMCKGLSLAYEESASKINAILDKCEKKT